MKPTKFTEDYDDDSERQGIINKLKKYQASFIVCANININYEGKTSYLKEKQEEFKNSIGSKNTMAILKSCYIASVKGVEFVGSKANMKLYGLADMLSKNDEVDNIIKELHCEHMSGLKMKPEHRLLLITISSAMVVNGINKWSELLNEFSKIN